MMYLVESAQAFGRGIPRGGRIRRRENYVCLIFVMNEKFVPESVLSQWYTVNNKLRIKRHEINVAISVNCAHFFLAASSAANGCAKLWLFGWMHFLAWPLDTSLAIIIAKCCTSPLIRETYYLDGNYNFIRNKVYNGTYWWLKKLLLNVCSCAASSSKKHTHHLVVLNRPQ